MEVKDTNTARPLSNAAQVRDLRDRVIAASPALADKILTSAYLSTLEALTDDASRYGTLKEFQFTSHAAVVGPVLVALRSAFNAIASKWVVRALMQQQNRCNAANARVLREMLVLNQTLLTRVRDLEARLATLESHAADPSRSR